MVIVPADVATAMGVDDDVFTIPLGDGATLPGIVISPLGEQLAGAADTTSASTAAVRLLVTALLEGEDGAAGLVLGSAGVPDPTVTAAFTRHVAATPGVAIVGASQLVGPVLAAGRANAVAVPDEPANDLTARQAAIDEVRPQAAAASSML